MPPSKKSTPAARAQAHGRALFFGKAAQIVVDYDDVI
jgi:hypothetical protein